MKSIIKPSILIIGLLVFCNYTFSQVKQNEQNPLNTAVTKTYYGILKSKINNSGGSHIRGRNDNILKYHEIEMSNGKSYILYAIDKKDLQQQQLNGVYELKEALIGKVVEVNGSMDKKSIFSITKLEAVDPKRLLNLLEKSIENEN